MSKTPLGKYDTSYVDLAKTELKSLEEGAKLPPSFAAGFIQIVGVLIILGSFYNLKESFSVSLVSAIFGGVAIAFGRLQQVIFDIRTLMLREIGQRGPVSAPDLERPDA